MLPLTTALHSALQRSPFAVALSPRAVFLKVSGLLSPKCTGSGLIFLLHFQATGLLSRTVSASLDPCAVSPAPSVARERPRPATRDAERHPAASEA